MGSQCVRKDEIAKTEVRILQGPHAGEVHFGQSASYNHTGRWTYGWYVPALDHDFIDKTNGEIEDLHTAFDKEGVRIEVGQRVIYVKGKEVCTGVVERIETTLYHQGCGWFTRPIKIREDDGGKLFKVNNPETVRVGDVVGAPPSSWPVFPTSHDGAAP